MSNDMFSKLNELLANAESVRAFAEAHPEEPERRKRKKKLKKKKKKAQTDDSSPGERTRSPSPTARQIYSAQSYTFQSPSAFKSAYTRPHSAAVPGTSASTAALQATISVPTRITRPASAAPARPTSAIPARATQPLGPHGRLAAEPWRDAQPPKYTATSLKTPELGTVPGRYQSPPWNPPASNDRDPPRQEIDQPVKETRFKHVLAVPAHVLAQSFFHPNHPSDRARNKQLQEDLKTARMDRALVIKERTQLESELRRALDAIHDLERSVRQLSSENTSLHEQVDGLLRSHKALTFERNQLEEQVRLLQPKR